PVAPPPAPTLPPSPPESLTKPQTSHATSRPASVHFFTSFPNTSSSPSIFTFTALFRIWTLRSRAWIVGVRRTEVRAAGVGPERGDLNWEAAFGVNFFGFFGGSGTGEGMAETRVVGS